MSVQNNTKVLTTTISAILFLSACSFVPKYQEPEVPLADAWIPLSLQDKTQSSGKSALEIGWREYFREPQLQALISQALAANHDLKKAALSSQMAYESYGITKAQQIPTIGASASVARSRQSEYAQGTVYSAALGISAFELDFFGRVRALSESALNSYLATNEARDAAQLSIINATASAYYQARISKALMDLADKVVKARLEMLKLAQLQAKTGVINAVTLKSYEAAVESARADFEAQERGYLQAMNALSVLIAVPYQQIQMPAPLPLNEQFVDLQVPAGIPSAVLRNRPDVRAAEFAIRAANGDIGAARAALFPTISLTASLGLASTELDELFKSQSKIWSISPSIAAPIFNRKALNANVKISELQQQAAVEDYAKTMQGAFREVSDALIARATYKRQYEATLRAVKAQKEALALERQRFKAGVSDGITLIDAERSTFAAEQGLLAVQLQLLVNSVQLYTAMGGGLAEYGGVSNASSSAVNGNNPIADAVKVPLDEQTAK
ncbi:MAG: efflux transporter outer membrane subunit [Cardiobacteriaceae bacterium]|nr:efflux transporter outer membrane subunit [Cardiobacteriaceae bacterium]